MTKLASALAIGCVLLVGVACGSDKSESTTTGTGASTPTGPTDAGYGATQSNPTCANPPLFTPGTTQPGDACQHSIECVPVCCPCKDGQRSYWGHGCTNGLCEADGSCADTEAFAC